MYHMYQHTGFILEVSDYTLQTPTVQSSKIAILLQCPLVLTLKDCMPHDCCQLSSIS